MNDQQIKIEEAALKFSYSYRDEHVQRMDDAKNGFEEGAYWAFHVQHSLCEAVADISFLAGVKKYYSGDSRTDIANFIEWAKEFEKLHEGIEWGVNSDLEYIDAITEFAYSKMQLA